MRITFLKFGILLNITLALSQNISQIDTSTIYVINKFEYADSCGDPLKESNIFTYLEGKVIEIIDGNSIRVQLNTGDVKQINLLAVEMFDYKKCFKDSAYTMLINLILNKDISITTASTNSKLKIYNGIVRYNRKDINRIMIESGIARYKEAPSYSMSDYVECVYQILERRARKKQTGLWKYTSK